MIAYDPFAIAVKQDPDHYYDRLRAECPVHRHELTGVDLDRVNSSYTVARPTKEFWSLFRHADCVQVAQDAETFSSREGPGPERMQSLNEDGVLIHADGKPHLRQRQIVNKALGPRAVAALSIHIDRVINELVDVQGPAGYADVVGDFAVPLTIRVLAKVVGVDEGRVPDLLRWGNDTLAALGGDDEAVARGFEAMQELFAYLLPKITACRDAYSRGEEPPQSVLAALVTSDYQGSYLTDDEILMAAHQLLSAGFETTTTAIASTVHLLCTNPLERRKFESDPQLIDAVVEESLRMAAPLEGLFRTATRDVEIRGCPIPAGAKIRLMWASANHDEEIFSDPGRFDISRAMPELRKHISFGIGRHACPGAALARHEMRSAIRVLFTRLPDLELDPHRRASRNTALTANGFSILPICWDPNRVLSAGASAISESSDDTPSISLT